MRRFAFAALALLFSANIASAQYGYGYHAAPRSLAGTTLLKVRNYTNFPVVQFIAVAHHNGFFSQWNTVHNLLSGGPIFPHQQAVVNFPSCFDDIHVVTASGAKHDVYNVNVCAMTYYNIVGW